LGKALHGAVVLYKRIGAIGSGDELRHVALLLAKIKEDLEPFRKAFTNVHSENLLTQTAIQRSRHHRGEARFPEHFPNAEHDSGKHLSVSVRESTISETRELPNLAGPSYGRRALPAPDVTFCRERRQLLFYGNVRKPSLLSELRRRARPPELQSEKDLLTGGPGFLTQPVRVEVLARIHEEIYKPNRLEMRIGGSDGNVRPAISNQGTRTPT
jgi:hypothetical protein